MLQPAQPIDPIWYTMKSIGLVLAFGGLMYMLGKNSRK